MSTSRHVTFGQLHFDLLTGELRKSDRRIRLAEYEKIGVSTRAAAALFAMERFIRENAGSDTFDRLDPALRERMIANGPSFFGHELAMFMSWIPSKTELAGLRVPVRTLAGRDNRGHYYYRAAEWLAKALGVDLVEIPGAHAPYLARPREFAAALLPLLNGELERAM